MKLPTFFAELKRRKVYRVAIAYAVVAWLLIQIATQVFPPLGIPEWSVRLVIMLVALGFPVALVLAWAFDLTPEGVKRTDDLVPEAKTPNERSVIAAIPQKSIAVLPFENLSVEQENEYFADGIQDDVLANLAKISDLKVISRTSVRQYRSGTRNLREIGTELGVAHILEGTVRRAGNRVRVNVQLINAGTDAHIWADTFDRELNDLFALQSELAERITIALPREPFSARKRPVSEFTQPPIWRPTKITCARAISFAGAARAIRGKMARRRCVISIAPLRSTQNLLSPIRSHRAGTQRCFGSVSIEARNVCKRRRRPRKRRCA